VVVLPQPLAPRRTSSSPSAISRLRSSITASPRALNRFVSDEMVTLAMMRFAFFDVDKWSAARDDGSAEQLVPLVLVGLHHVGRDLGQVESVDGVGGGHRALHVRTDGGRLACDLGLALLAQHVVNEKLRSV